MKSVRIHDNIYLKTNRYKNPKKSFQMLHQILKKRISPSKKYKLLDIGCANGELLYFLNKKFKNIKLYGVDIKSDLINLAKKKVSKNIILNKHDYKKKPMREKYDFIICSGVLSIFDELGDFFLNVKKNMKKNSVIYLFNAFNEYDFDVNIKYKDLNSHIKKYQSGQNIWSIKTIHSFFKFKKLIKHPFNIDIDVKKNRKDLIRSWTIEINKKKYFTNCLNIIQSQMWLEIK